VGGHQSKPGAAGRSPARALLPAGIGSPAPGGSSSDLLAAMGAEGPAEASDEGVSSLKGPPAVSLPSEEDEDEDAFGDVTHHNASLRGLVWLVTGRTELEPLLPSARATRRKRTSVALNVLAELLARDGPLQRSLWASGASPIPLELRPVAR